MKPTEDILAILVALPNIPRFTISANGRSMAPTIVRGDLLDFERCSREQLKQGDIALVRRGDGRLLVHRVVRLAPLSLKGDAMESADDGPFEILARLVKLRPTWRSQMRRVWVLAKRRFA